MGFALVASSLCPSLRLQGFLQSLLSCCKLQPQEWHQYFHCCHSLSRGAVALRLPPLLPPPRLLSPPPPAVGVRLLLLMECNSLFKDRISRSRSARTVGDTAPEAAVPAIEPDIVPVPSVLMTEQKVHRKLGRQFLNAIGCC
jgi:hypothetical protein